MQRFKRLSLIVFSAALLLLGGYYAFLFSVLKPEAIRQGVVDKWEDLTGANLAFGDFKFHVLPFPSGEMGQATLSFKGPEGFVLQAEKLKFSFHFLNFLFGKSDISSIEILEGRSVVRMPPYAGLGEIDMSHIRLKISSIRAHTPIQIRFSGDYENVPKSVRGEMTLVTDRIEKWSHRSWALNGNLELRDFPVEKIGQKLHKPSPFFLKKGKVSAKIHFHKEHADPRLDCTGQAEIHGLVYEIQNGIDVFSSPEIDASARWELAFNPESEEFHLKQAALDLPVGHVDFSGQLFPAIGELKQMRLSASGISLEAIPQYYQPFKEAVPLNIGFSGKSNLEMSLEGTFNHLSLHAHWDFTPALLTYGRYFSKPKDVPMDLSLDFLIRDGRTADGDFTLQLKNAGMKGTLRKFNLETRNGELNVITNKFKLAGWETLLPPFQDVSIDGECKLLANFTGNLFQNPHDLNRMFNVTLESGSLKQKDGLGIPHLSFVLDYGEMALDLKQGEVSIGDSQLGLEFSIYNPLEKPLFRGKLSSERIFPLKMITSLENFAGGTIPEKWRQQIQLFKEGLAPLLKEDQPVEKFSAEIEQKEKKWLVSDMHFEIYQGAGQLRGEIDFSVPDIPQYHFETEIDRMNLSQFYASQNGKEKMMSGSLFITANLKGQGALQAWTQNLEGDGLFSVTGGEFYGFDVMGEISKINGFSALENLASGKTPFDDLRARFTLKDGKISTPKLVLLSNNLSVSARGEASSGGVLNYGLDAFLPMPLAARIFGEDLKPPAAGGDDLKFGPIPFLLSGSLKRPELEPNPGLLPDLQERIQKKKSQKVFQNFPAEDFFLTRPKAS